MLNFKHFTHSATNNSQHKPKYLNCCKFAHIKCSRGHFSLTCVVLFMVVWRWGHVTQPVHFGICLLWPASSRWHMNCAKVPQGLIELAKTWSLSFSKLTFMLLFKLNKIMRFVYPFHLTLYVLFFALSIVFPAVCGSNRAATSWEAD